MTECMFCMEKCDNIIYLSPVCNCPIHQHIACRRKWDEKYPSTCPLCRNVVSAVNTRKNLNVRQQNYQSTNNSIRNTNNNVDTYVIIEEVVAINQNSNQQYQTNNQNQVNTNNLNKIMCMILSGFIFGIGFWLLVKNL